MTTNSPIAGILLVDKSAGMTSHDVVAMIRRVLGTRAVGHAGTLDPMATGLLVVLLGEGTKLSAYLTRDSKRYVATVRFGATTDTLDADGTITERCNLLPPPDAVRAAVAAMVGTMQQRVPAVSAVKAAGEALHRRVRRGEPVEPPVRTVTLHSADVIEVRASEVLVDLLCSKGFYVRSFARDLGLCLGTLAHLVALQRVASGPFALDEAIEGRIIQEAVGDPELRARVRAHVRPIADAARAMTTLKVGDGEAIALSQGKTVTTDAPDGDGILVVRRSSADLVCIAQAAGGSLRSVRGFVART